MSLFPKNPNEAAYGGGRKHFVDVIKNQGNPTDIIFRNPEEDFNVGSTLIVNEAEEALFCKDGMIEDVFPGGRYVLDTENYPFISSLFNIVSGGISSFNCLVFFVRLTNSARIGWGTPSPIQVYDANYDMVAHVQASGSYIFRVTDSKLLWRKLFGGNNAGRMKAGYVQDQLQGVINEEIMSVVASTMEDSGKPLMALCSRVKQFREMMEPRLVELFMDYGLSLEQLSIETLRIPSNDPYMQLKNDLARREQEQRVAIASRARQQRAAMDELGGAWAAQQQVDVMQAMARNPAGGAAGAAAGIGMGLGAMGAFGQMAGQVFPADGVGASARGAAAGAADAAGAAAAASASTPCPACGAPVAAGSKFCPACGAKMPEPQKEAPARPKFCVNCGAKLDAGIKFCPNCGHKIEG